MGTGAVVTFAVSLAVMTVLLVYGVVTEGRRGAQRLDRYGRVVADAGAAAPEPWVVVDEEDAESPGATANGLHIVRAWLAAQGIDHERMDPSDIRVERIEGDHPALLRFSVRAGAIRSRTARSRVHRRR